MKKNRCIIIGASPDTDIEVIRSYIKKNDKIACADGGYKYAAQLNIVPYLIVGDFDSSKRPELSDTKIISLPVRKDDTDTVAVIKECLSEGFDEFLLFGMTGGRTDHTFANLSVLYKLARLGKTAYMIDKNSIIFIAGKGKTEIKDKKGCGFGIFPFACEKIEVSLWGFEYELSRGILSADYPVGVSNTIVSDNACIELFSGFCVAVIEKTRRQIT